MKFKKKHKRRTTYYTYKDFLTLFQCCRESHQATLLEKLSKAKRPAFLFEKEVPENFNTITYGQLDDISRAASTPDPAIRCIEIITGLKRAEIYKLNVVDVFGFLNFCKDEINRINKLFLSIKPKYSSEEVSAGVEELNFGTFGVIDWYAKRMGITNQDEVYDVAWIRIYTCMKNDNMQNLYERRLREQYIQNNGGRARR